MILSVHNVNKSYGKEKVLYDISFAIEKPSIIALVGPNGSGKSTLLSIITNLLSADSGNVTILNRSNKDPDIFREISFMQDNTVLYDYLTGYDHLQFIGDIQGLPKLQINKTADRIGITNYLHKKVGNYSLGMKQHLLLAMAILNDPKLIILDEPLNGLDPTSSIKVRNLLLELKEEGKTILLSSHNLAEIDRVTSQILFLKKGTLIEEDISQYERVYYELTVSHIEEGKEILTNEGIVIHQIYENKLTISLKGNSIGRVIEIFNLEVVEVLDIKKIVLGSEDRYQKIFGEESVST